MPKISEHALAVVISALAVRIRDLTLKLQANEEAGDALTEEEVEAHVDLQDTVAQYRRVMTQLREEYELALKSELVGGLPQFDDIIAPFRLGQF